PRPARVPRALDGGPAANTAGSGRRRRPNRMAPARTCSQPRLADMLTQPSFKPHLHVEVVPGEGVFLLSGSRQSLLRGRLYEAVAPWVGARSPDAICDQLQEQASPAEVYFTLMQLEQKGFLCEAEESLSPGEAA